MGLFEIPDPVSMFESAKNAGLEREIANAFVSASLSAAIAGMWRSGSAKWADWTGTGILLLTYQPRGGYMNYRLLTKCALFLLLLAFLSINSFGACGVAGLYEGGYRTAAAGTNASLFQQVTTGCNFYLTTLFLKVSNVSGSTATSFVVNMYDGETAGVCSGNIRNSWTLTVGGTHGASDVFSVTYPGQGLTTNGISVVCINVPSATGFVATVGFSGVFGI
jgi:hypothetical protein